MDEVKVKAIKEWIVPRSVKDMWSFLKLTNYYKIFIKGFSPIVAPLINLLKKDEC
ncbi:unnamed protein product [Spirodela intermedia]|uniref:Uncharacterized protein n=1 Tax=Spirodela intermedia TaxID=51605 RepID=A0ABN7E7Q2_SPIIN|nr:unnamed protein product [Spirodela intermedia]